MMFERHASEKLLCLQAVPGATEPGEGEAGRGADGKGGRVQGAAGRAAEQHADTNASRR